MALKATDDEFIGAWMRFKSPAAVAKAFGLDIRQVYNRRTKIEDKYGIRLDSEDTRNSGRPKVDVPKVGFRAIQENVTGPVIIGGDLHAWPGERSKAFAAFVEVTKEIKPSMVVMNGDVFDGARISRHPPGGWANLPTVADELDAVKERLAEIEAYAPADCPLILPAGNHDTRFSSRLAMAAPEYMKVQGFDLADHLPAWQFCWSLWINHNIVVKHRWHQGIHAAFQNVLKSGKTMVTNHTHGLQVKPYTDYNGIRYGIECGTLSEVGPTSDKYSYAEDNPMNWGQGFVVLTFTPNGMLLEPELCRVIEGNAWFRGRIVA